MASLSPRAYPPGEHPDLPPPVASASVLGWLRTNLFSSAFSSALTIVTLWLLYLLISGIADWMVFDAVVSAESRTGCRAIDSGACWAVVVPPTLGPTQAPVECTEHQATSGT